MTLLTVEALDELESLGEPEPPICELCKKRQRRVMANASRPVGTG